MQTLETGTQDLLARIEDRVAVLTFNRPDRRNALSSGMYAGFSTVLPALAEDPDVRVVMVTGAGGAFCAGRRCQSDEPVARDRYPVIG